jgi:3D (Asp-Asp-Asp) domain-containing protein
MSFRYFCFSLQPATNQSEISKPWEAMYTVAGGFSIKLNSKMIRITKYKNLLFVIALLFIVSCSETKTMEVTATAYNSVERQTKKGDPTTAAWGDKLEPGMKAIAVSRDLLKEKGIEHGAKVKIKGLPGKYKVLDKMNKRWKKKIDIYMGTDVALAREWGKQRVEITWNVD